MKSRRLVLLARQPELVLALGVAMIIGLLIVPLPPAMLDVLLASNLTGSALILVAVLFAARPLSMSTFPTLLLFTTLFRLALNLSTTRLILSTGHAGAVVEAFGHFVVRGDLIVGVVIFLVLTLIQLLVISKGAERVAEVGARFTLDAMPGKQMSIDADLRAGSITDTEAKQKRAELNRESQFYGAMDGAMKFIKGDALSALIITGINLIAGLILGVMRHGMSISAAAETYSILTIGDGLVAQIPALLITLAAGVLTTRVAAADNLGASLLSELFANAKVVGVAGAIAFVLALIPGLPMIPFFAISIALGALSYTMERTRVRVPAATASKEEMLRKKIELARNQRAMTDRLAPTVNMLSLHLGRELWSLEPELNANLVPDIREAIYIDTGVRVPGVSIVRSGVVPPNGFSIFIKEVPVFTSTVDVKKAMVADAPEKLLRLGIHGEESKHPTNGMRVAMIDAELIAPVQKIGLSTWTATGVIGLHLAKQIREHITVFIGFQEVSELVKRLERAFPDLVREVVPKLVSIVQLTDILRRLADEMVSIRDLKSILEALGEHAAFEQDGVALTEHVRAALSLQIAHAHGGLSSKLGVLLIDPEIEDAIRSAICRQNGSSYLALEPELRRSILNAVFEAVRPVAEQGARPVLLAAPDVRRFLRKLLESRLSLVSVLSHQELPPNQMIQPLGRISIAA